MSAGKKLKMRGKFYYGHLNLVKEKIRKLPKKRSSNCF